MLVFAGCSGSHNVAVTTASLRAKELDTLQKIKSGALVVNCAADPGCPVGSNCAGGHCTLTCIVDSECGANQTCNGLGKCVSGAPLESFCLRDIKSLQSTSPISCVDGGNDVCAAQLTGTYCDDIAGSCTYDCDGANKKCGGGLVCDCTGRCVAATPGPVVPPGPPPPSATLLPTALQLAPDASTSGFVDVSFSTTDARYSGSAPTATIRVALLVRRPTGTPSSSVDAIQVNCGSDNNWDNKCTFQPQTPFVAVGSEYHSSRRVWVRLNPSAPAPTTTSGRWPSGSNDLLDHEQRLSIAVEPPMPPQHRR